MLTSTSFTDFSKLARVRFLRFSSSASFSADPSLPPAFKEDRGGRFTDNPYDRMITQIIVADRNANHTELRPGKAE